MDESEDILIYIVRDDKIWRRSGGPWLELI